MINKERIYKLFLVFLMSVALIVYFFTFFQYNNNDQENTIIEIIDLPKVGSPTLRIENTSVSIQLLGTYGITQPDVGIGTFISTDGWMVTPKHVISYGVEPFAVFDGDTQITNEEIILHPYEDLALVKLYNTTTPCIHINSSESKSFQKIDEITLIEEIILFTYPTIITPGMSGTPLLTEEGNIGGMILQKNNLQEKKGQGVYFSSSLIDWINQELPKDYFTLCKSVETIQ